MKTAKEWIDEMARRPKTPDLIAELLPDANEFMLIAGRPGIGKTNLVLQLGHCLATGTPFLGLACKRTVVGYVGFEGTPEKMVERLEKIGRNFRDLGDNFRFERTLPLILERKLDKFKEIVTGCRVIILDPLKYLIGGDYCKPKDAVRFVSLLQDTLKELNLTAIINHHIRKPNPKSLIDPGDLYSLKGATEYVDSATSVLILERTRQGHKSTGGFAPVDPDSVTLYFAKHRDAIGELPDKKLKFNKKKLLFELDEAF